MKNFEQLFDENGKYITDSRYEKEQEIFEKEITELLNLENEGRNIFLGYLTGQEIFIRIKNYLDSTQETNNG